MTAPWYVIGAYVWLVVVVMLFGYVMWMLDKRKPK